MRKLVAFLLVSLSLACSGRKGFIDGDLGSVKGGFVKSKGKIFNLDKVEDRFEMASLHIQEGDLADAKIVFMDIRSIKPINGDRFDALCFKYKLRNSMTIAVVPITFLEIV